MSGIVLGAEVGGEIGAFGGPVGLAAGVVIGGLIGLGATILAAKAVQNANSKADSQLKSAPAAQACADCGDGPDCFEPPEGSDPKEFNRQLKEQQDAINKLSPDEMLKRFADGDLRKAATGTVRGAGDAAARQAARDAARSDFARKAFSRFRQAGKSVDEAKRLAAQEADNALSSRDATHALDWIAGGDGAISGVGDSRVNRSIGSQWNRSGPNSQLSRQAQLRKAAEKAKARGDSKMDVDLKEC